MSEKVPAIFQLASTCWRWLAHITLLAILAGIGLLVSAGIWLIPADKPIEQADVIVVLAGGYERTLYAADLYNQGYAPKVWISRSARENISLQLAKLDINLPREEDIHREILLRKKVPVNAIEFFGEGSVSTIEEAHVLRAKISNARLKLIIVTSPAHLRRAGLITSNALRDTGISTQMLPTPYENFDPQW